MGLLRLESQRGAVLAGFAGSAENFGPGSKLFRIVPISDLNYVL
uniref:Uncharacterized protein n=1 Tax=Anguilla anguilla TaxID=7936 RepID=A0A0E9XIW5_ANGAN